MVFKPIQIKEINKNSLLLINSIGRSILLLSICLLHDPFFISNPSIEINELKTSIIYSISFGASHFFLEFLAESKEYHKKWRKTIFLIIIKYLIFSGLVIITMVFFNSRLTAQNIWLLLRNVGLIFLFSHLGFSIVFYRFYIGLDNSGKSADKGIMGSSKKNIVLKSETGVSENKIIVDNFLYAKSEGHYIRLYYESERESKKQLHIRTIRSTLKKVEIAFGDLPEIKRIHKSYIANISKVHSFEKEDSGGLICYKLEKDIKIPYSHKYYIF